MDFIMLPNGKSCSLPYTGGDVTIVLATTWGDEYGTEPRQMHVLFKEGLGFHFLTVQLSVETGELSGWCHKDFYDDLEKGIRFFLQKIREDRKCLNYKHLRIVLPAEVA